MNPMTERSFAALRTLNGSWRLFHLRDELTGLVPVNLTDDQQKLLRHLEREIDRIAVRERDDAMAQMAEVTP